LGNWNQRLMFPLDSKERHLRTSNSCWLGPIGILQVHSSRAENPLGVVERDEAEEEQFEEQEMR
jgi:hypothetical protein